MPMCNSYVVVSLAGTLGVSCLMGSLLSSPNVAATDLGIWAPEPWPREHRDTEDRILPHQEDGRWVNFYRKNHPSVVSFFASWLFGPDDSNIPGKAELNETLPVRSPSWCAAPATFAASRARLTWLGHATVLAEVDGATILTDPIMSERASAVQFAGPRRYTRAPCQVSQLPHINGVVVSHSHYDHLDLDTVSSLAKTQPHITWFVPMGMAQWLLDNTAVTADQVRELSWWEEAELPGTEVRVAMTPSNHWGKRTLSDTMTMLWGSWAVLGPTTTFWFGGDTGYSAELFRQIGDKYGPFTMAAIPIGAYQPNWFMKYDHVHPGEAVEIHKDIRSGKSLGIHWGTFKLTTENYLEPPSLLTTFLNQSDLDSKAFVAIDIGDSINIDTDE